MLKQRILTALVLAPLMLCGIFLLPLNEFQYFIALIVAIGAWEWANMSGYASSAVRVGYGAAVLALTVCLALVVHSHPQLLSAMLLAGVGWWLLAWLLVKRYPNNTQSWRHPVVKLLMGVLVLLPMWAGFVYLKQQPYSGLLILCPMLIIWAADSGAYFAGRAWGVSKLAPNVSPGKSWAGVWGGVGASALMVIGFIAYVNSEIKALSSLEVGQLILATLVTVPFSVLGDLLESMFKRERGIKDSSSLLPGHGGIMDRIDSMSSAVPVFAFVLWLFGWSLA